MSASRLPVLRKSLDSGRYAPRDRKVPFVSSEEVRPLSARAFFPPSVSDRADRGLLREAKGPGEAVASPATGTTEDECAALAAMSAEP